MARRSASPAPPRRGSRSPPRRAPELRRRAARTCPAPSPAGRGSSKRGLRSRATGRLRFDATRVFRLEWRSEDRSFWRPGDFSPSGCRVWRRTARGVSPALTRRAPLAAVARVNNAERLVCVDAGAARLGLSAGLTLADARARHPALVAVEAEPAEEARLLSVSATGAPASRRSPRSTAATGSCSTFLASRHLFGGEAALARGLSRAPRRPRVHRRSSASPAIRAPPGRWRGFRRQKIAPEGLERQGLRQALSRSAARRARPRRDNCRRHGAGGLAAHRRHRVAPARADRGAFRRHADGAARRAERPRARRDLAALRPAGFLRRAALRLARADDRGGRGDACASSPTISSCCSSARPRARGGSSSASIASTATCAASGSAPAGRSTRRARSRACSPSGWRARRRTRSTPASASI